MRSKFAVLRWRTSGETLHGWPIFNILPIQGQPGRDRAFPQATCLHFDKKLKILKIFLKNSQVIVSSWGSQVNIMTD
jgi:hypothetical protein